eukprot:350441-Chlamydomonas_euryale.AAC.3
MEGEMTSPACCSVGPSRRYLKLGPASGSAVHGHCKRRDHSTAAWRALPEGWRPATLRLYGQSHRGGTVMHSQKPSRVSVTDPPKNVHQHACALWVIPAKRQEQMQPAHTTHDIPSNFATKARSAVHKHVAHESTQPPRYPPSPLYNRCPNWCMYSCQLCTGQLQSEGTRIHFNPDSGALSA